MRRTSLALALVGAAFLAGCSVGQPPGTSSGGLKGVQGQYFYVNLFSTPVGGVVASTAPASLGISCGASTVGTRTDASGVLQYNPTYFTGADRCGQFRVQWADSVTLTATPAAGNVFVGWAGDCFGSSTCTLTAGADKAVVAIFALAGQAGHPNWSDPAVHGPALMTSALACATCHGDQLQGQSIAPACNACHAMPASVAGAVARKTGLVASILSVSPANSPANTVVTFSLRDGAGANVDVTGADGRNLPMPITMSIMNFGTDPSGNVLPYKNATGGNPGTVAAYAAITNMSITSGTYPSATAFTYPEGSLTRGGVACTLAAPCTCAAAPNNCTYTGTVGYGFRTVAPATLPAYGACTTAAPCTCSAANPCAPALPTANGSGMLTRDAATGVYTYTFTASPFPAAGSALLNNTHTAWLATYRRENLARYLDGQAYTAVNVQLNFNANTGGAAAARREIVTDAACARCHDGFQAKAVVGVGDFHSSARIGAGYCNVCHYEGRGTNGFADSATFVHRIHAGKDLTKITTGQAESPYYQLTPGAAYLETATACGTLAAGTACTCTVSAPCSLAFKGMTATYPQDVRNCAACHAGAASGAQWQTRPTIAACGSCHDRLSTTFLPIGTVSLAAHPASAPAIRTNADCANCHDAPNVIAHHRAIQSALDSGSAAISAAPGALPAGARTITYEIDTVSAVSVSGVLRPRMTFKLKVDGVDANFGTYDAVANPELIPGFVGQPTIYFVFAVPQDGIAAPVDFNASKNVKLKDVWSVASPNYTLTRDAVTGFYTLTLLDTLINGSVGMLTGGLGYAAMTQTDLPAYPYNALAPTGTPKGGLVVPQQSVWKVATGFTGRRVVVDNARCTACHANLGVAPTFHGGARNDAPTCSFCHTPNRTSTGWSANASTFIHGIHGAEARSVGFTWVAACATGSTWDAAGSLCRDAALNVTTPKYYYPEIGYPGKLRDCTQCHLAGGYDFSASAAAVPGLLWSTVATGTPAAGMSTSPYVTAGTSYGAGFSYATGTGVITPAAGTTLVSSPISAACFSCHDSAPARSHMEAKGGFIYQARSAAMARGTATETCLSCHGQGKAWAIDQLH